MEIEKIPNIDDTDNLLKFIENNLKPKEIEKDKFGEVFTPIKDINEILNHIPEDKWLDPNLKWFDHSNGMGNFPIAVYLRLMKSLVCIENISDRKKHILENMLYMSELNMKNVYITKMIFDPNNELNLNIYNGDSLTLDVNSVWGIDKFDIVMGNPPYNKEKEGKLKGGYGGRSLWDLFVVKTFEKWVKPNGYVIFIHPPCWRKPEHYLWDILSKKQMLYLKCISESNSKKIFGCSTIVDYYILHNVEIYTTTDVLGQDNILYKVNLKQWKFLPGGCINEVQKILGNNEVIYSRTIYGTDKKNISKLKSNKYNLPVVHNMTQKNGLGFVYSSENKGHFEESKVILSLGRHQYPYNDYKGEYGMTQICFGLKIKNKEEGDLIIYAINSQKFKDILKYTKWSTFMTDWRMFKYIKKDFYKEFLDN